jgi:hypothetical protein
MICVQKIWLDNMNGSVIKHKGGEFMYYNCRLNIHLGGVLTHGTTKLKATSLGHEFQYGTEAKIKCDKNHVNGIEKMGKIASTPFGYANPDELDVWKKEHRQFIHDSLNVSWIEPPDSNSFQASKVSPPFVDCTNSLPLAFAVIVIDWSFGAIHPRSTYTPASGPNEHEPCIYQTLDCCQNLRALVLLTSSVVVVQSPPAGIVVRSPVALCVTVILYVVLL